MSEVHRVKIIGGEITRSEVKTDKKVFHVPVIELDEDADSPEFDLSEDQIYRLQKYFNDYAIFIHPHVFCVFDLTVKADLFNDEPYGTLHKGNNERFRIP